MGQSCQDTHVQKGEEFFPALDSDSNFYSTQLLLARLCRPQDLIRMLRVSIPSDCSGRDRAVFVYAKVEVPKRASDLVRGATTAEDWAVEIIFKDIARPISREHPTRENSLPIADPP